LSLKISDGINSDIFIHVYEDLGRVLLSKRLRFINKDAMHQIDLSFLDPGIYVLRISAGDYLNVKKLIER